jgi:predicted nucleotidyltransferase
LAALRLRDRDSIITKEDLVFRVFGYSHPTNVYICDAEYAPAEIYQSDNPKAFRNKGQHVFYKFYEDESWKFIQNNYSQYMVFHEMLHKKVIGANHRDIARVRKPDEELIRLVETKPEDGLITALQKVLEFTTQSSSLSTNDLGVFGSMLHGFHHPKFSDIDFIIYGRKNTVRLCEALQECYRVESSLLKNEFETDESIEGKRWKFQNYGPKAYVWHQRRKMIYALFNDRKTRRVVKTEFEPVKRWEEISNTYDSEARIVQRGWTRMNARVVEDQDAPFVPSIYGVESLKVLDGAKNGIDARRIVSYMEEFRMQARKDEIIRVEGNLEEVITPKGNFYQVALTYCPRYYEQVLKVVS